MEKKKKKRKTEKRKEQRINELAEKITSFKIYDRSNPLDSSIGKQATGTIMFQGVEEKEIRNRALASRDDYGSRSDVALSWFRCNKEKEMEEERLAKLLRV